LLVGNDVVDLRDPENQPDAIHPRFDQRAFTPVERTRLTVDATAHATRWCLWAAKESAFKLARKIDGRVRFLPRQFSVQITGRTRAVVQHALGRFDVAFSGTDDWVHAVATRAEDASARVRPSVLVERTSHGILAARDASSRVRAMATTALESSLSIAAGEVEILGVGRAPVALWRESRLPVDVSLSHHGRLIACAWSPTE
jgi:phosphopantetheinyl transferase (holo-ACP synthase)